MRIRPALFSRERISRLLLSCKPETPREARGGFSSRSFGSNGDSAIAGKHKPALARGHDGLPVELCSHDAIRGMAGAQQVPDFVRQRRGKNQALFEFKARRHFPDHRIINARKSDTAGGLPIQGCEAQTLLGTCRGPPVCNMQPEFAGRWIFFANGRGGTVPPQNVEARLFCYVCSLLLTQRKRTRDNPCGIDHTDPDLRPFFSSGPDSDENHQKRHPSPRRFHRSLPPRFCATRAILDLFWVYLYAITVKAGLNADDRVCHLKDRGNSENSVPARRCVRRCRRSRRVAPADCCWCRMTMWCQRRHSAFRRRSRCM